MLVTLSVNTFLVSKLFVYIFEIWASTCPSIAFSALSNICATSTACLSEAPFRVLLDISFNNTLTMIKHQ
jgi:hypothetical protein